MSNCRICNKELKSKRSKICESNKCKSKWKIERNKNLNPITKSCIFCGHDFKTKDKRNNFCSSSCKSKNSNKTKLEKYGTLSLESKDSVKNRSVKLVKPKTKCKISNCLNDARTKGYCSNHYIKYDYLKTEHGRDVYRLGGQRRRKLESKTISKAELNFLKTIQSSCIKCNSVNNLSLDHHIPLSRGGSLELMNTIILCGKCNSSKHNKLPEEFYTKEELDRIQKHFDYISKVKSKLKKVYFLFGCFGAGKTWIANQLKYKFTVVEYDVYKRNSIKIIDQDESNKPILYVSPIMITPFINKYSMKYNVHRIALVESLGTIEQRLKSRGGILTKNVVKRQARIETIAAKYSHFSGNSLEVLEYLKTI